MILREVKNLPLTAHKHDSSDIEQPLPKFNFPALFDLKTLDGSNGFTVFGLNNGRAIGKLVTTGGDINGDGRSDLVLGDPAPYNTGSVFVIFGQKRFQARFNISNLDGKNGFVIQGIDKYRHLGDVINTAGDINGDGKDDLILGVPGDLGGLIYIIFGQDAFPAKFNLTRLDGNNGFIVKAPTVHATLGYSVSTAGDINGDGIDDLILGAPGISPPNYVQAASYIIFGQKKFPAQFDLETLNGENGFVVRGLGEDGRLGISVSTVGDFNGDGKDDIVLGAPGRSGSTYGTSYVIFGQNSFPAKVNLTLLNGKNGFTIRGVHGTGLGTAVNTAGDINGDGKSDLVLSTANVIYATDHYVIFGKESFPAQFNLSTLNGNNGFLFLPNMFGDAIIKFAKTAGDINGDGKDDLLLSTPQSDLGAGISYVVYGQEIFPKSFNLSTLNGKNGFIVRGLNSGDYLGSSISTAGDVNGDGITDFVLGADGAERFGESYVIFGTSSSTFTENKKTSQQEDSFFTMANGYFIEKNYDFFTRKNIVYDTNKRLSAARESHFYQFFSLLLQSINSLKQSTSLLIQRLTFVYQNGHHNISATENSNIMQNQEVTDFVIQNSFNLTEPTRTAKVAKIRSTSNDSEHINIANNRQYNCKQQNRLFNSSVWEVKTQVYLIRIFKGEREIASIAFCGHPLLCQTLEDVLVSYDPNKELQSIGSICQTLPPTWIGQLTKTVVSATQHGTIQGSANVISYGLDVKGFSKQVSQYINYAVYYGGMFALQYTNHYQNLANSSISEAQKMTTSICQAALDTGTLMLTQSVINQGCKFSSWLGQKAKQYGWEKAEQAFQAVSSYGGYSSYAYQAFTQGALQAGASIISGIVSQKMVENMGKYAVDSFFKNHEHSVKSQKTPLNKKSNLSFSSSFFSKKQNQGYTNDMSCKARSAEMMSPQ